VNKDVQYYVGHVFPGSAEIDIRCGAKLNGRLMASCVSCVI